MTPEQLIDLMDRYGIEHRKATGPEIQELLKKLDEYMVSEFGLEIETQKLKE